MKGQDKFRIIFLAQLPDAEGRCVVDIFECDGFRYAIKWARGNRRRLAKPDILETFGPVVEVLFERLPCKYVRTNGLRVFAEPVSMPRAAAAVLA